MRMKFFGLALLCLFCQFFSSATILFPSTSPQPSAGDTTQTIFSPLSPPVVQAKRIGLFGKLKNKLLGLLLKQGPEANSQSNPKKIMAWVALGLFAAGGAMLALGAGSAGVWVLLAGLPATIVALALKGGNPKTNQDAGQQGAKKKKNNWALIIAAFIALGGLVALVALASWGSH